GRAVEMNRRRGHPKRVERRDQQPNLPIAASSAGAGGQRSSSSSAPGNAPRYTNAPVDSPVRQPGPTRRPRGRDDCGRERTAGKEIVAVAARLCSSQPGLGEGDVGRHNGKSGTFRAAIGPAAGTFTAITTSTRSKQVVGSRPLSRYAGPRSIADRSATRVGDTSR